MYGIIMFKLVLIYNSNELYVGLLLDCFDLIGELIVYEKNENIK